MVEAAGGYPEPPRIRAAHRGVGVEAGTTSCRREQRARLPAATARGRGSPRVPDGSGSPCQLTSQRRTVLADAEPLRLRRTPGSFMSHSYGSHSYCESARNGELPRNGRLIDAEVDVSVCLSTSSRVLSRGAPISRHVIDLELLDSRAASRSTRSLSADAPVRRMVQICVRRDLWRLSANAAAPDRWPLPPSARTSRDRMPGLDS